MSEMAFLAYYTNTTPIETALYGFLELKSNWSVMGEGEAISENVVNDAVNATYILRNFGFKEFEFQPGLDGEVLILAFRDSFSLEALINKDRTVDLFLEENNRETISRSGLNRFQLSEEIQQLDLPWLSLESLIQPISQRARTDFQGWLSGQAPMVAFLSTQNHARLRKADQTATTSKRFIAA